MIIALHSDRPGCGKTTLANMLIGHLFDKSALLSFADPVKAMAKAFMESHGYSQEEIAAALYGSTDDKSLPLWRVAGSPSARRLMQVIGTEMGRNGIHPDVWTENLIARALSMQSIVGAVIVDDLRFPGEYKALAEVGAYLVKIERDVDDTAEGHCSEGLLSGFDFDVTLKNDGDKVDLVVNFVAAMDERFGSGWGESAGVSPANPGQWEV